MRAKKRERDKERKRGNDREKKKEKKKEEDEKVSEREKDGGNEKNRKRNSVTYTVNDITCIFSSIVFDKILKNYGKTGE